MFTYFIFLFRPSLTRIILNNISQEFFLAKDTARKSLDDFVMKNSFVSLHTSLLITKNISWDVQCFKSSHSIKSNPMDEL